METVEPAGAGPGTAGPAEPSAEDIPVLRRRERLTAELDLSSGRGLEIGPLFSPLVTKDQADVRYVDVHTTAGLRDYYRDHAGVPLDRIVEVDHALYDDGVLRSVSSAAAADGPVDWIVASHVVEHVPDVVGWFADLAEALADEGQLALVVPDRRYTFDATRVPTTVGELLDAHGRGDQRPSLRAVHDYYAQAVEITAHDAWRGAVPTEQPRTFGPDEVAAALARHRGTTEYIDCHAWVWTPAEFVDQLSALFALGELDFVVDRVRTTPPSELEFYVVLRRLPRGVHPDERARRGAGGFSCPPDAVLEEPAPVPGAEQVTSSTAAGSPGHVELSDRERAFVLGKRRAVHRVRSLVGRLRRR